MLEVCEDILLLIKVSLLNLALTDHNPISTIFTVMQNDFQLQHLSFGSWYFLSKSPAFSMTYLVIYLFIISMNWWIPSFPQFVIRYFS